MHLSIIGAACASKKHYFFLPESPAQLLLCCSTWSDVDGKKKLSEVDVAVPIRVERPEDVVAEVPGIATWETLAVDLHKGWRAEFSVGAVWDETLVPLLEIVRWSDNSVWPKNYLDCIFIVFCIGFEEDHILFCQTLCSWTTLAHDSLFLSLVRSSKNHPLHYIRMLRKNLDKAWVVEGCREVCRVLLAGEERDVCSRQGSPHLLSPCPAFWQHCTAAKYFAQVATDTGEFTITK